MTTHVSMLTATDARSHIHLIVGSNPLAAARCGQSLSAGASPILLVPETAELHYALQKRIDDGEVKWIKEAFRDEHLFTLGREEIDHVVDAVFVTSGPREPLSAHISTVCKRNRIPVNVVDAPQLCTFSLLSTHVDGPLQIGITTNGRGCKLASRIRREVAASLPPNLGSAFLRLGDVRRRIQEEDHLLHMALADGDDVDDSVDQLASFNKLVTEADIDAAKNRRMRWLGQICEYWPLKRLAAITDADVSNILQSYSDLSSSPSPPSSLNSATNNNSNNTPSPPPKRGRIILAGSGPGHPDLLTRATHKAIRAADLVLADKLVPAGVLDLVPRRTPVRIARKFPGNADAAQAELHEMAVQAAREGKTVLRLKQGDPYVYGRGGEEVEFFRGHGFGLAGDRNLGAEGGGEGSVVVLPGVTSALSAPLFAGIPSTQRDVADQVLICTGTGKKGKAPVPPEYVRSRTVVFLMALHRVGGLVAELTGYMDSEIRDETGENREKEVGEAKKRVLWPRNTPCAVIERASCPDQRVIRTTLDRVVEAVEQEGSRPPGLLVVGAACEFLNKLDKGQAWRVEEGFRGLDFVGDGLDLGE
ncbi:uroporphyrin-III C-methyltransferase [Annulohypoxylon truncatum]|uniref:uroporphyrin-III C-methyltransferase n=1 Tax=Annulohypoxylon truncatum TaxID=327061 RepID=UPI002007A303|nr:uroporphyrin-III C-methyltransferase [Annulohypoxylon truncatum]KAI1212651.1 uroporphyrin-III C-methyltransferase [Annulohypoxylon truncatum]